jgi:hypothetical protein
MLLIGDAYAAFVEESAVVGVARSPVNAYSRAWQITGSVIAIDAAALVYWVQTRKRRRANQSPWTFDMAGGEIES